MKLGCQHKGHKGCAGWLLVGALNQKKTLEGALSVIEKRDGLFAALITTSSSHLYGEARLLEELLGLGAGYDAVRAGLHPAELRHVVAQLLPRDLPDAAPIRAQYRDSQSEASITAVSQSEASIHLASPSPSSSLVPRSLLSSSVPSSCKQNILSIFCVKQQLLFWEFFKIK